MKDVGLRIMVQKELRERFLAVCQAQDKPAAQVLREFMRAYVDEAEESNSARPLVKTGMRSQRGRERSP
jgi:predicted DNA-binding protein